MKPVETGYSTRWTDLQLAQCFDRLYVWLLPEREAIKLWASSRMLLPHSSSQQPPSPSQWP